MHEKHFVLFTLLVKIIRVLAAGKYKTFGNLFEIIYNYSVTI